MLGLIGNMVAISGYARLIVDIAMYFGLFLIVAMALNFQYGNAGVPNLGCALQVIMGGFTVTAFTTRLTFWLVTLGGVELLPYATDFDWIYNNQINVSALTNAYLKENLILCVTMFIFTLALSLVLGLAIGWLISFPSIRLKSTYLMISLITLADASQVISRNVPWIGGGTLGLFIPNLLAFYPGDRSILMAVITLFIGLISYFIFSMMLNSPYGRLMRAVRENDLTLNSVGKDVTAIRRNILMFASGITAIAGALITFYFSYFVGANFQRSMWTYWPWLMLIIGGPGNNAGTFVGTALIIALRRILIIYKWYFDKLFFFPISYFESFLLGLLLLVVMVFKPSGLISEKLLYIPGIDYEKIVMEEGKVDWRTTLKARKKGRRLKFLGRKGDRSD